METLVVALGGNAIQQSGEKGTAAEQFANVSRAMASVAELADRGYRVVLTHGNGPQVGTILLQQAVAEAAEGIPAMPMDVAGAMSQGQLGYMMQQCLQNELRKRGRPWPVATVVTQMVVDPNDPAFTNPTKPIGPFYNQEKAEELRARGYTVIEDSGRGYRRVVPSPQPAAIAEIYAIRTLVNSGALVICSGGGGIPVVRDSEGILHGVEAVIDKDMGASLIAQKLDADRLLILTDVANVAINYRKPDQQTLGRVGVDDLKRYMQEGQFAAGSMGPKVRAGVGFVEAGGKEAIITHLHSALSAIEGETGTHIVATTNTP
ncbi:MAG: carbamate kinase [Chloroflexota bacterium]